MGKQLNNSCENQLQFAKERIKELETKIENSKKIQNNNNQKFDRFINETLDPWLSNLIRFSFVVMTLIGLLFSICNFVIDGKKLYENITKENIEEKSFIEKFNEKITARDSTILEALSLSQKINLNEELVGITKDLPKIKQNDRDVNLLKFIEHIFIYLIPILVFLGLYYYYSINYISFLRNRGSENDSTIEKNRIRKAKDALQMTKSLFLSSILAYTIIKVVEKVILAEKSDIPSVQVLVAYGIFILLLMMYLIFSHSKEHSD